MIYFGYPLDIHGWKTKPETEPDWFRGPNLKTVGEKSSPNPNPQDPKPADIRPETAPLPSLPINRSTKEGGERALELVLMDHQTSHIPYRPQADNHPCNICMSK